LDVDGALKFLALENVLINNDGYWIRTSDYSLYQDAGGRFHVIPHDSNETFSRPESPGGPGGRGRPGRFFACPAGPGQPPEPGAPGGPRRATGARGAPPGGPRREPGAAGAPREWRWIRWWRPTTRTSRCSRSCLLSRRSGPATWDTNPTSPRNGWIGGSSAPW